MRESVLRATRNHDRALHCTRFGIVLRSGFRGPIGIQVGLRSPVSWACSLIHIRVVFRCVHRLDIRYSLPAVTAIVVAYAALVSNVPRQHGVLVFYASTFVLNAFIVYGSIAGVVKLCKIRSEP